MLVEACCLASLLLFLNILIQTVMSDCSVRKTCPFLYERRSSDDFFHGKDLFIFNYPFQSILMMSIYCVAQSLCWTETAHCTLSDGVWRQGFIRSLGIIGKSCRYFSLLISRIKPLPYARLSQQSCLPAGRTEGSFLEK